MGPNNIRIVSFKVSASKWNFTYLKIGRTGIFMFPIFKSNNLLLPFTCSKSFQFFICYCLSRAANVFNAYLKALQ